MKIIKCLAVGILMTSVVYADFVDEADFPTWADEVIEIVNEERIMTGFGDGTFRPNQQLNRAEAVTLILRAKNMEDEYFNGFVPFPDVARGVWYEKAVGIAAQYEWIKGKGDGRFHASDTLTRAEFSTLLSRAFDLETKDGAEALPFEDVEPGAWYSDSVAAMYEMDFLRNALNKYYRPGESVTRAEAAWTFAQIVQLPGLTGEAGANDFSNYEAIDSRRVAIKPRDFNANLQGYDIEKNELRVFAETIETTPQVYLNSDWQSIGTIRIKNQMDHRATLDMLQLKMRFDRDNVGPGEGFSVKLEAPLLLLEKQFNRSSEMILTGLEYALDPGEEVILRASIKPSEDYYFYFNEGQGKVYVAEIGGTSYEVAGKDSTRSTFVKATPVGYENRDLTTLNFIPKEQ